MSIMVFGRTSTTDSLSPHLKEFLKLFNNLLYSFIISLLLLEILTVEVLFSPPSRIFTDVYLTSLIGKLKSYAGEQQYISLA